MSQFYLSEINIYPVKSLGGISLQNSDVTDRGLKHDRRWLIINNEEKFITQRTHPQLALIKTKINGNKLILGHKTKEISPLVIPIHHESVETVLVSIWQDLVEARVVGKYADEWLSDALGIKCRLAYMQDETQRPVDRAFAADNEIVSFADAYPFLIIGQSSLDDLNSRLKEKLPMNRFRPNFVFSGGEPFDEDKWKKIRIGEIVFNLVKPCSRCVLTTVDQNTAEKNEEPLRTLSTYRSINNKVYFGQNLLHEGNGTLKVGDEIEILELK
ncbi:MAG: MOSC N-terminal beta barrel domain-containing protein [Melioribacteraceae bacterium]